MSRGLGAVQRRLLEHLSSEAAGVFAQTGEPRWESVHELTTVVFGTEPTDAARASVRRALRRLAHDELVDLTRMPTGRTYLQRRRHRARYLMACPGPTCRVCDYVRRHPPVRFGGTLVEKQLREISGAAADHEAELLHRFGFHEWLGNPWNDYDVESYPVRVSCTCARRHLTDDERRRFRARWEAWVVRALQS